MKALLIITLLLTDTAARSQPTINVDDPNVITSVQAFFTTVNGVPYSPYKYNRVTEGSIFEPAQFSRSVLFIREGKKPYVNIRARLNLAENTTHYLDDHGIEMVLETPVTEIYFYDSLENIYRVFTRYPEPCHGPGSRWLEIMEKGKLTLYRETRKSITENKPYGSAISEQKVQNIYMYWLTDGTNCMALSNLHALVTELQQRDPAFQQVISSRKYDNRKAEDWVELVKRFNALH